MAVDVNSQWGIANWGAIQWGGEEGGAGIQPISDSFSDTITLSDFVTAFLGVQIETHIFDALVFFDLLSFQLDPIKAFFTEMLFFDEGIGLKVSRPDMDLGDFVNLSDQVVSELSCFTSLSDTITLIDKVDEILGSSNSGISDTLSLTDAVSSQLNAHLQTVLSDSIALTDSIDNVESTDFNSYIRRYLNDVVR